MRIIKFGLALALAVGLVACQKTSGAGNVDGARIAAADSNSEWVSYGKGYSEQRFSPLDKVNATNVGQLGLAWYAQFDTDRGQEATPLMVDGVLYTTTAWSKVFAFDAATGKLIWSYDPKVDGKKGFDACCDVVNRGVAVWKGRVYVGTLDARLVALDAKDGHVVWQTQVADASKPFTITQAPRVVKDKVLIGESGAEYGGRGYLSAYDAATGKLVWRFFTVPNPYGADGAASDKVLQQKALPTWPEGKWKLVGGGGTVWDAIAYDPALDLIYFGTDNGTPWNQQVRSGGKGDNLFISSIIAVKADTGEYVWHYQVNPGESWDYSAVQPFILTDLTIGGQPHKVLMQAPKNGFFYVLDRTNGKLLSAKPFVPVTWAKSIDIATGRPVENPDARYKDNIDLQMPAPLGAHNWHPMSFSPKTGLVYIPAQSMPFAYQSDPNFVYKPGGWNLGVNMLANAGPMTPEQTKALAANIKGWLIAWDPVNQKPVWTVPRPYFWNAGVLSTGGNLVFQGAAEGQFYAYDAKSGKQLWSYTTQNGVIAAPMTYELNGEQYVALMVGSGGGGQVSAPSLLPKRPRLPGRLLVFKLGGKATAPPFKIAEPPPLDLTKVATTGDKGHGYVVFNDNCQVCHGANATGSWLPDLTRSLMITTPDDFNSVVIQGVRAHNGMVSFSKFLSAKDVEDVRAFLISQAKGEPLPSPAAGAKTASGAK
ncbi:PQQ-dependent dehydrogenase, methanol/ethanol family [Phenylobacterium sp.]|uniref:PQQ-dependent dehydrogenase, methanol/ethanol family n=1 Tax=Phenylobacterium sp. TaxID=1871053 RepID=UPI002DEFA143|nr:PQQ-dependent dehydrogenase, methanol/ethanol family [Phenylobacterium sp.]